MSRRKRTPAELALFRQAKVEAAREALIRCVMSWAFGELRDFPVDLVVYHSTQLWKAERVAGTSPWEKYR